MWALQDHPDISRGAEFCTLCSLSSKLFGKPEYSAFCISSLDSMNAWTNVFNESMVSFLTPHQATVLQRVVARSTDNIYVMLHGGNTVDVTPITFTFFVEGMILLANLNLNVT